jgi:hypothetical protein
MNLKGIKFIKENADVLKESVKQGKIYVDQGKLSKEDLQTLIKASPDPKYVGWMSKIWINEKPDIDDLRNTVEEFHTFAEKGKSKIKDINQFKSFKDLKSEVDRINQSGEAFSIKDLESDYETLVDNDRLLIMVPHTHEASRKLGLSYFAFRSCEGGGKDSAWCTTYKAPDHFNDYYYKRNVTFYYIRVRSEDIKQKLKKAFPKKYKQLEVVALAVLPGNKIDGYDGKDKQMSATEIKTYKKILGLK